MSSRACTGIDHRTVAFTPRTRPNQRKAGLHFLLALMLIWAGAPLAKGSAGGVDPFFRPRIENTGAPFRSATQPDGKILVWGDFTRVQGTERRRLARLHPDGSLDASFTPPFFLNQLSEETAPVDVLVLPDGKLIVIGLFTNTGGYSRNGIVRLDAAGNVDPAFQPGQGATSEGDQQTGVIGIARQAEGKLVVAGNFDKFDGLTRYQVARVNADGSHDTTFQWHGRPFGIVSCVAIEADGRLLVGGRFLGVATTLEPNGVLARNVVRLNPDGSVVNDGVGSILGADLFSRILPLPGGGFIVTGLFTFIDNNLGRHHFKGAARFLADGTLDPAFNTSHGVETGSVSVTHSALQPDGKVLLGISDTSLTGIPARKGIYRLNSDGTFDTAFNAGGAGLDAAAEGVMLQPDGKVIALGTFKSYNGIARLGAVRVLGDGQLDPSFNVSGGFAREPSDASVDAIAVQSDGKILIGGKFHLVNGTDRGRNLARLHPNGTLDTSFLPQDVNNERIYSLAVQANGRVLAGLTETRSTANETRLGVVRLLADGALDTSFHPSNPGNTAVAGGVAFTIGVQPDNKILIGGFLLDGNLVRKNIRRLNADGTPDATFNLTGLGENNNELVRALALQTDGRIMIGGNFTSVNGNPRQRLARLNANGTPDFDFLSGTSANDTVHAIAIQPDNNIVLAGAFTSVRGAPHHRIARLTPDGSLDPTFLTGIGFDGVVHALAVLPDGKIVAGGSFANYNGSPARHIARLLANGTLDPGFHAGSGAVGGSGGIRALAPLAGGQVLVGGDFTVFAGQPRSRLARLVSGTEPPLPELGITLSREGGKILSWDDRAIGWLLQRADNLSQWSAIGVPITAPGSHTHSGSEPQQFFRLTK